MNSLVKSAHGACCALIAEGDGLTESVHCSGTVI